MARRIVLAASGSLGDIFPYLAIGLGLRDRGHDPVLATCECHRRRVEDAGLDFRPMRPEGDWIADPRVMARYAVPRVGLMKTVLGRFLPVLRQTYNDLLDAVRGADVLVSHPMCYAASLVAEATGIAWASTMITPLGFFSAWDPPAYAFAPIPDAPLRALGPRAWGAFLHAGKLASRPLAAPIDRLRRELGLPRHRGPNPLSDVHSPTLSLALFSGALAARQPDWPPQAVATGFPFLPQPGLPEDVRRFLDAGPPPVVFTLGSAVASARPGFFAHTAEAARRLGIRAALIVNDDANRPASPPPGVEAFRYAAFGELFPRASAVVHHAGIGTTGLAMRSGSPSLCVPLAFDQPDNADRLRRLGLARVLPPRKANARRLAEELEALLADPGYTDRADPIRRRVEAEDGVEAACQAIEAIVR